MSLIWALILATLLSVWTFRKLDTFSKLIAIQVCVACFVEFIGWQLKLHHLKNPWLYNSFMLIEFSLLFLATLINFEKKFYYWLIGVLVFYWVCWGVEIYKNSVQDFAVKTYVIGAIILLVSYFFTLFKSASNRNPLLRQSQFWFSIGILLFFGCSIPYFSLYDYIVLNSNKHQRDLLSDLLLILTHFRYLCTAVAFVLVYNNARKKPFKVIT